MRKTSQGWGANTQKTSQRHGESTLKTSHKHRVYVQKTSHVVPLETKSGSDYTRHKTLDNLMAVGEWGLEEAIVPCGANVSKQGGVKYLPWYAVSFLEQESLPESLIVTV